MKLWPQLSRTACSSKLQVLYSQTDSSVPCAHRAAQKQEELDAPSSVNVASSGLLLAKSVAP